MKWLLGMLRRIVSLFQLRLPLRREPGWKTLLGACLLMGILGTAASEWATQQSLRSYPGAVVPEKPDMDFSFDQPLPEGQQAPDFSLPDLEGTRHISLRTLRGGKPVVLIFGSLSCDLFCNRVGDLDRLHRRYQDRVEFLCVYVREAGHRIPGYEYVLDASRVALSGGDVRRRHLDAIRKALAQKGLTLPWVIDEEASVQRAYLAWPLRLVLIGRDGRIDRDLGHSFNRRWDMQEVETWLNTQAPAHG